jgi:hypothetical protein
LKFLVKKFNLKEAKIEVQKIDTPVILNAKKSTTSLNDQNLDCPSLALC